MMVPMVGGGGEGHLLTSPLGDASVWIQDKLFHGSEVIRVY